jgi:hypothetical protein
MYEIYQKRFRQLGIGRRFIPLHFSYSPATKRKVQDNIKNGKVTLCQLQLSDVVLPDVSRWPLEVDIPKTIAEEVTVLSRDLADALAFAPEWTRQWNNQKNLTWHLHAVRGAAPLEFTPHLVLRAMIRAHALRARRSRVIEKDLEFVRRFIPFCNYGSPVQL